MNSKLNQIQNWSELAKEALWSASILSKTCRVSVRTLERFFLKRTGKSPKAWLAEERQSRAIELLRDGRSIKETAVSLGYRHPTNFSRQFAKHWGTCPTRHSLPLKSAKPVNVAK